MSEEQRNVANIINKFITDIPYIKDKNNIKELEIRFKGNNNKKITKIDYDNICHKLLSSGFKANSFEGKYLSTMVLLCIQLV